MTPKARKILGEAFATLDRTADIPDNELDPDLDATIESMLATDWEPPAPRVRMKRDTPVQQQSGNEWAEWVDTRMVEATIRELRGEVTVLREMIKSGGNVHIPGSSSHKVIVN